MSAGIARPGDVINQGTVWPAEFSQAHAPTVEVGAGGAAEVYAWRPGQVCKLLRRPFNVERAEREWNALVLGTAHRLPVPTPIRRGIVDSRPAVIMERLYGRRLSAAIKTRPWKWWSAGLALGSVHALIHSVPIHGSGGLPSLKSLVAADVEAGDLPAALRAATLKALAELPVGDRLLHGDFRASNVVDTDRGLIVIDWDDAAIGPPEADVALTDLLLSLGSSGRLTSLANSRVILKQYQRSYRKAAALALNEEHVKAWRPICAARWLSQGELGAEMRGRLLAELRPLAER